MISNRQIIGPLFIAIFCVFWGVGDANAEYEGASFGVEEYDSMCGGSDLDYCRNTAEFFAMGLDYIDYDQIKLNYDQAVDGRDFADNHIFGWGADDNDPYGTDFADVIYFSGHGSYYCSPYYFSVLWMGDDEYCQINLAEVADTGWGPHVQLANGGDDEDANVLILRACHSLQWCIFNQSKFYAMDQGNSGSNYLANSEIHYYAA